MIHKCYKRISGRISKFIYYVLKPLVSFVNYLSPRVATTMFVRLLKTCGVNMNGCPRFISTRIRIDEFSLISIGEHSVISENVILLTHDYSCTNALRLLKVLYPTDVSKHASIKIGDNVFIGMGCIILPGTEIENNVIIGAGSVVKGHLKGNTVYAGNPLKPIKEMADYAAKVQNEMRKGLYDYRFD